MTRPVHHLSHTLFTKKGTASAFFSIIVDSYAPVPFMQLMPYLPGMPSNEQREQSALDLLVDYWAEAKV
ncbi:hypothetical protein PISMIDRAFT_20236 [Pisolithus microcarpus 441]|uniref:Uncharacterized protein n=1 Tax=Pisolithus microcarpus 441 TaxID=765257 RepID=A0A0C9YJS1_9AGAM|nr:hypothetical protein PISMIDRAFT_20236 [Pisolithus microcarpus 441]